MVRIKPKHITGLSLERDCGNAQFADIRLARNGDACIKCGSELVAYRGIEVGHVFFLGTKYSEAMKCNFLDEQGRESPMVMGCYGIGVSRVLAAAVEQHHDQYGIYPAVLRPLKSLFCRFK